jgi:hypothetical protein
MYNQCIVHISPRLQNSSTCGHAQAFLETTISRPHIVETRLDATCCAMALTSCFVKIGTFYNAEAIIITPLFLPSTVANVIDDTS